MSHTVRIAIGSLRQPKIDAVKAGFQKVQHFFPDAKSVEYLPRQVESNIPQMPLSLAELMEGAYNRAENLRDADMEADFYVGLEGGFFKHQHPLLPPQYFLQGWVYVSDGEHGAFGATGTVAVPAVVAQEVVDNRKELGDIIDAYGGAQNIRDRDGAFGVFTRGLLTRQASFEFAVMSAFAPFYNRELYKA